MKGNVIFLGWMFLISLAFFSIAKADGVNLVTANPGFEDDLNSWVDNNSLPNIPGNPIGTGQPGGVAGAVAAFITTQTVHFGSKAFHGILDIDGAAQYNGSKFERICIEQLQEITSVIGNDYYCGGWVRCHKLVDCKDSQFGGEAWVMICIELVLSPPFAVFPDNPGNHNGVVNNPGHPNPNTTWNPTKAGSGNQIIADIANGPEDHWYYVEAGQGQPPFHGDGRGMRIQYHTMGKRGASDPPNRAEVWFDDVYLGTTPQYGGLFGRDAVPVEISEFQLE